MYLGIAILMALSALLPAPGLAQEGERLVTLGDDLTEAQETEVLELLGASRQDRIIRVTSEETTRGSRGIIEIPPGTPAISSTAIICRPEGSGIDVRTQNIEEVTAGMYAQSLVTAGITDADVRVAAPEDAPAEGLTALTGIFKAYRQSPCTGGELDPERERLAQRELATTVELGEAIGDREAASEVVLNTQEQVVSRKLRGRAQIQQVVDRQLEAQGGGDVPDAARNRLVNLMVELGSPDVDWGGYAQGWTVRRENRNQVRITPRRAPATATAGPDATAAPDAGDAVTGTVTGVAGGRLTVDTAGGTETIAAGDNVEVVRNGRPATVGDIQATDRVTVERDANGRATRIVATSTGAQGAPDAGSVVTGTVTAAAANALTVRTGDGATRNITLANAQGLDVTRNRRDATVGDIRRGDRVVVTLAANDRPTRIVATSRPRRNNNGSDGPNPAWLLTLLPLFLLMRNNEDEPTVRTNQNVRG